MACFAEVGVMSVAREREHLRSAIEAVEAAQTLVEDPGDRHEISLVIELARSAANVLDEHLLAEDLRRFAGAIRSGLFARR
jgi:hypothetical protein